MGKLKCHHKAGIALACVGLCLSAAPSWSLPVSNPEEFRTYLNKNTNWNNYQFNFTSLGECFVRYKANGKALGVCVQQRLCEENVAIRGKEQLQRVQGSRQQERKN